MIKSMQKYLNILNRLLDIGLIVGAYYAAIWLWLTIIKEDTTSIILKMDGVWMFALLFAAIAVLAYQVMGLYDSLRARPLGRDIIRVLQANLLSVVAVAAVLYLLKLQEFSRGVLAMFYLLSCAFVLGKRMVMRYTLRYIRNLGYNQKHVVVVGDGAQARQCCATLRENPQYGFIIDGYVGGDGAMPEYRCLGALSALSALLNGANVDQVVAALEPGDEAQLPKVIQDSEKQGIPVSIIPFYNDYIPASARIEVLGNSRLLNVRTTPLDDPLKAGLKRTGDVVGALLLIVLTSPLMLLAAIGTRISSPGPIIFKQKRVGLNKREFTMYKFRSMRVNAAQDTAWTKDADPRKTRFGAFLRKTSIDELPQFFNVLKGDMSLVGPRPEIPHFVEQFRETIPLYMVKHRVRPGITGWAQVNGLRGDTSIEERIKCDIWYIENWTVWLDLRILFMTVFGGMLNKEKVK